MWQQSYSMWVKILKTNQNAFSPQLQASLSCSHGIQFIDVGGTYWGEVARHAWVLLVRRLNINNDDDRDIWSWRERDLNWISIEQYWMVSAGVMLGRAGWDGVKDYTYFAIHSCIKTYFRCCGVFDVKNCILLPNFFINNVNVISTPNVHYCKCGSDM